MKKKSPQGSSHALGLCLLGAMASTGQAQLQSAGDVLVDLNFTTLTPGDLPYVPNPGTLGGGFEAIGPAASIPKIRNTPNSTVRSLYLDGNDFMLSVTGQTPLGNTPVRLDAPAGVVGAQPSRSVEVWVYNESLPDEETVIAWGKRGGGDGQNYSCLYGINATWGALGQWGGPDLGWFNAVPPTLGTWHHITYVHTGPDTEGGGAAPDLSLVYVDGVLNNSENAGVLNTHAGPMLIGAQMEGDGVTVTPGLRGTLRLGKVRVHDGALTAAQVLNNYDFEKAGFPATVPVALAAKTGPIHRWSFSEADGTKVNDPIGFQHGAVRGAGSTWTGTSLALPGGGSATAAYVDLPNRLISRHAPELGGTGEVTLEMWVTNTGVQNWARFFDFGSTNGNEITGPGGGGDGWDYLFLSASEGTNTGRTIFSLRHRDPLGNGPLGAGGPGDVNPNYGYDTATFGSQRHLVVVWKDQQYLHVHEEGQPVRELRPGDIKMVQLNDVNCWLGRSTWLGDANLQGDLNEFRIYDRALSAGEVLQNRAEGPEAVLPGPPDDDNDTLPNWYEIQYASATLNSTVPGQAGLDGDSDGRTNSQEFQTGTNPIVADTDGDGLNDGAEVTAGTNPLVADSDGDGLTDGAEVNTHLSNPLVTDTDNDGYLDGQEVAGGSSPIDANSIPVVFLVGRFSFDNPAGEAVDGARITDSISGLHAYVRSTGGTFTGSGLTLPGGSSETAPYVDLPNQMMSRFARNKGGRGVITMEGWVTVANRGGAAWQRILDFGSSHPGSNLGEIFRPGRTIPGDTSGQDYFFISAARGDDLNLRRVDWTNNDSVGGTGNSFGVDTNATTGTIDTPLHFAVTYDEALGQLRYYENGVQVATANSTLKLDALNDVNCWLGRSNWTADGNFGGELDEFRIYTGLFSPADVLKSFTKGPGTLPGGNNATTDITALKITNPNGWPEWYVDRVPGLPAPGSDTDGDGVTALVELGRGSSPTVADTDGDGLSDAIENGSGVFVSATSTGTNPANPDTDDDGLTDSQELAAGTDPFDQDTDSDLAFDGSDALPLSADPSVVPMAHRWPFDDLEEGAVPGDTVSADVVGGAAFNAIIRGNNASSDGTSVLLGGGNNNNESAYIDLPNGLASSRNRITMAGWVTVNSITNWSRILDFGNSNGAEVPPAAIGNGTDYLFYSASNGTNQSEQRLAIRDDPGGESFYNHGYTTPVGVETFFAITIDSVAGDRSVYTLYREGQWGMRMFGARYPLSSVSDPNCWLGRSQFAGDPQLNGAFNEFRIYDGILNERAIRNLYATGPDDKLDLVSVVPNAGQLDLTWESREFLTYTIESSPNLQTWVPVEGLANLPSAGETTTASVPLGTGRLYYRVKVD